MATRGENSAFIEFSVGISRKAEINSVNTPIFSDQRKIFTKTISVVENSALLGFRKTIG